MANNKKNSFIVKKKSKVLQKSPVEQEKMKDNPEIMFDTKSTVVDAGPDAEMDAATETSLNSEVNTTPKTQVNNKVTETSEGKVVLPKLPNFSKLSVTPKAEIEPVQKLNVSTEPAPQSASQPTAQAQVSEPKQASSPAEISKDKASPSVMRAKQKARALVIDDDPIMCKTFELCLRKDFEVHIENSAAQGILQAGLLKPTVVILDLFMPNVDGFEVLKQLRNHPGTSGIPIICSSGDSSAPIRERVYQLGAIGFFPKPPNLKTFASDVQSFLTNMNMFIKSRDEKKEFTIAFNEGEKNILLKDKLLQLYTDKKNIILLTWKDGHDFFGNDLPELHDYKNFYYLKIKPSLITKFPFMQELKPIFTDMNSLVSEDTPFSECTLIMDDPSLLFNNDDAASLQAKIFSLGEHLTKNFQNILFFNTRSMDPRRSNIIMTLSNVFFDDF